jgi:hypothetical protein
MKPNLKTAVEAVRTACFNGERITGTEIKKKYGISTHLLPVMINAGYIQKMKGLKYKWKVQAEILPVMLKRIQDDITAMNMDYLNRSLENKRNGIRESEMIGSASRWKFTVNPNYEPAPKIQIERPEITDYSKKQPYIPTPTVVFENPKTSNPTENYKVDFKELINKVDTLIQLNKKDVEIAELKEQLSENSGKKFVFKLFGLPIFAINRS